MFFSYTLRNLAARPLNTLATIVAIAATCATIIVMQTMVDGLLGLLSSSSHPDNAIVHQKAIRDESGSDIPDQALAMIAVAPGIAKSATGAPLVSPEKLVMWQFQLPEASLEIIPIRGVDAIAFEIHPAVRVEGRFPGRNEPGLVVGAKALGKVAELKVGGNVRMLRNEWPVTGVLHAPGTKYESEIWSDRGALATELQQESFSSAYLRLEDLSRVEDVNAHVARDEKLRLMARAENDYYRAVYYTVAMFADAVVLVAAALALGAIFAATNMLYSSFLLRMSELATLASIGYTRRKIAGLVLREILLVAGVSIAIAIGVAMAVHGREIAFEAAGLYFRADVTAKAVLIGAGSALVVALVSGIVTCLHVYRFGILQALRAG